MTHDQLIDLCISVYVQNTDDCAAKMQTIVAALNLLKGKKDD